MTTEKANTPVNPFIVAISVLLPSFLALAASSATNVCQPNIAGFYGATQYEANTVITCYIISAGLMLPVTGYLVQLIGKKLLFYYSLWIFALGCLLDGKNGEAIISIAFDSGGVTTGPVTVPFLLTFGAGVATVRGGKNASSDSFGITGICSIGPLITTMILFLCLSSFTDFSQLKNTIDVDTPFFEVLSSTCLEVLLAIVPIFLLN